ncbi:hypothetical protein HanXRQr2_Chr08g0343321 [Helianthus annuus]|uniref:Uncharacterized protein n=1 Tax=Helianthus annuus TaxID=4232 RepID=A0A9K3ND00_HELAN|nr:hypothetical protein HanXRQr2_Chr08g0343321 [Helianthus annuus]KAJ0539212.1 hypothetical protein HanHA300_Chr08g0283771 [Helianthus annuus]KAJ0553862.1 hypothetical protein HanHA89_Chr08g0301161 [Helianthus annuus]KAJ0722746.1 hypothetical protein HanOQP8_Chr08g0290151 [Helianthus annuus]KAJ0901980.1 hypothetical protein HanPSC8_Chr08g0331651 [Helianthus annuus]
MTYVFGQNSNMKNLQNMSGAVGDLTKESDNWRAQLQADAHERSVVYTYIIVYIFLFYVL